jgi:hypothetical protein
MDGVVVDNIPWASNCVESTYVLVEISFFFGGLLLTRLDDVISICFPTANPISEPEEIPSGNNGRRDLVVNERLGTPSFGYIQYRSKGKVKWCLFVLDVAPEEPRPYR